MPVLPRLLLVLCLATTGAAAQAFGAPGHRLIGSLAESLLAPPARARVQQLLLGMPLGTAAIWADCVRGMVPAPDGSLQYDPAAGEGRSACAAFETPEGLARMRDFAARNRDNCSQAATTPRGCHTLYHFANIAFQRGRYEPGWPGAEPHDVVHATQAALAVLQGRPAPAPFRLRDAAEALLLLAHMVGDLHQPLHVGALYLDAGDRATDPATSTQALDARGHTRGGNRLEDQAGNSNLHALWDGIDAALEAQRAQLLAEARGLRRAEGDPASWPAAWASETVQASRAAFEGLRYERAQAQRAGNWALRFDDRAAYLRAKEQLQREQIVRAAARLAQLLDAAWP